MVGFWRLVTQVTGWHVAASMCFYAIYAGAPLFRDAFELTGVTVGWLIAALTLGYAVFQLPVGMLTDRYGEHLMLTVGLVGLSASLLLVGHAPVYPVLLGLLFVMGSMYGTAAPGTNKAIFDNITDGHQHRAIGIKQIGSPLGSAVSAILVTSLAGVLVWYFGMVVVAIVGLLTAAVFYTTYIGASKAANNPPDFTGLLANGPLVLVLLAGVCIGAGYYTAVGFTVLYVDESIGATVAVGGVILAVLQISSSTGKIGVGWLADTLPCPEHTTIVGLLLTQTFGGALFFLVITTTTTPVTAGLAFVAVGLTALGSTGLYYSYIYVLVGDSEIGAGSAAGSFATTVSGLFAPPTFGYLVDSLSYTAAWGFLSGLSFTAAILVLISYALATDMRN